MELVTMVVTVATWLWICFQANESRKMRQVTVLLKTGGKQTFFYRKCQLELERDEKSVISSNGLRVTKENGSWKEQ